MARKATDGMRAISCDDDDVTRLLRSHGLRPTRARCQLLSHLRSTDRHPSAEEITAQLRGQGVEVGVATVYQNLSRLVDTGLVRRLSGTDGRSRFDADVAAHDHAMCESCGRIVDVDLGPQARRAVERASTSGQDLREWLVTHAGVELRGICPECRRH